MSVTALDAATSCRSRGAQDLGDLGAAVAQPHHLRRRAPFNSTITAYIRGVGQSDPVWGVEPGVGVYVDDVYLARPQAALLDILDVERIEVLRGPQGTLYGKNTIGGAIKYVTRATRATYFSGTAGLTVGRLRSPRRQGRAQPAAGRTPAHARRLRQLRPRRLWQEPDHRRGRRCRSRCHQVVRATVDWLPTDAIDVRLAYDRYRDRSGRARRKRLIVNPFDPLHTPPDPGNYDVRSEHAEPGRRRCAGRIGDGRLGHRRTLAAEVHHRASRRRFRRQRRLRYPAAADLRRSRGASPTSRRRRNSSCNGIPTGRTRSRGPLPARRRRRRRRQARNTIGNTFFAASRGMVDTRSAALYGDLTWTVGDAASAGARPALHARKRRPARCSTRAIPTPPSARPTARRSPTSPTATTFASLSPRSRCRGSSTDDAMLYAQATRGFKSGSYNIRANTVARAGIGPCRSRTKPPLATKSAPRRNGWTGGSRSTPRCSTPTTATSSSACGPPYDSNGDGIDDDLLRRLHATPAPAPSAAPSWNCAAQAGEHLKWLGHAGYLETQYDEYISAGVDIADDQRFTNAPRWTGGVSAIAESRCVRGGWLLARIDGNYQSKAYPDHRSQRSDRAGRLHACGTRR